MRVRDETLFVLALGDERHAFDTEEEAVDTLKNDLNGDVDPESVNIFKVNMAGDEWAIQQVPWSNIALQLIKGGG